MALRWKGRRPFLPKKLNNVYRNDEGYLSMEERENRRREYPETFDGPESPSDVIQEYCSVEGIRIRPRGQEPDPSPETPPYSPEPEPGEIPEPPEFEPESDPGLPEESPPFSPPQR